MAHPAALSNANVQMSQTYIGPEETTLHENILEKVAMYGMLLGSGILLAIFFTQSIRLWKEATNITVPSSDALPNLRNNPNADSQRNEPTNYSVALAAFNTALQRNNSLLRTRRSGG
jgi:hypothetical protein